MTFDKTITPNYEIDGRRKRLTGFIGQITDESGLVLHSCEYSTNSQADTALNAIVYDLLMDYCERGLVDTLAEPPVDIPDEPAPQTPGGEGPPVYPAPNGRSPSCLVCYDDRFIRGDVDDQPCPYCVPVLV